MSFHYVCFSNPLLLPVKSKFQSQISISHSHRHLFLLFHPHTLTTYISLSIAMPEAPSHYLCNNNNEALKYIEDVTSNADEIQKRVLAEILSSSAHAEYLQRHGLDGRTDRHTFKNIMPVVTYEDLKPDIDRIANGDTSQILCSKPISEFLTRSVFSYYVLPLLVIVIYVFFPFISLSSYFFSLFPLHFYHISVFLIWYVYSTLMISLFILRRGYYRY